MQISSETVLSADLKIAAVGVDTPPPQWYYICMKFLIASDIHGSAEYCRLTAEAFAREKADKLLLLGDILYHGPRNPLPAEYSPQEVVRILSGLKDKIICVQGNCDSEVDQMVLPFPVLCGYAAVFADGLEMILSHGHRETPPLKTGSVYITGHTHVPLTAVENGCYHLNPGSVSLPKEGSGHGYIVYENRTFAFKTFDGNIYDKLSI